MMVHCSTTMASYVGAAAFGSPSLASWKMKTLSTVLGSRSVENVKTKSRSQNHSFEHRKLIQYVRTQCRAKKGTALRTCCELFDQKLCRFLGLTATQRLIKAQDQGEFGSGKDVKKKSAALCPEDQDWKPLFLKWWTDLTGKMQPQIAWSQSRLDRWKISLLCLH